MGQEVRKTRKKKDKNKSETKMPRIMHEKEGKGGGRGEGTVVNYIMSLNWNRFIATHKKKMLVTRTQHARIHTHISIYACYRYRHWPIEQTN